MNNTFNGEEVYSLSCPSCGASISVAPGQKESVCEYCGKKIYFHSKYDKANNSYKVTASLAKKVVPIIVLIYLSPIILGLIIGVITVIVGIISALTSLDKDSISTKEVTVLEEKNPFSKLDIKIDGTAPYAKITSIRSKDSDISNLRFHVDKSENLSNGDVVTITAEESSSYEWTEENYEYTIDGLKTYIDEFSDFSEEEREALHAYSVEQLDKGWEDIKEEFPKLEITFSPLYMSIETTDSYSSYYGSANYLYDSFEVTLSYEGKEKVLYQFVRYDDLYIDTDGKLVVPFQSAYANYGFLAASDIGLNCYEYIAAYEDKLKMKSDMSHEDYTRTDKMDSTDDDITDTEIFE